MSDYDTLMYPNSAISGNDFSAQEKQDAKMSLLLSDKNRENGATVAAWHSRAAKSGLSYLHYMKQDNNNIQKNYDVDSMSPMLRRALAYAPQYTAYFKDYIPEWEDVIAELEKRRNAVQPKPEPPSPSVDQMSSAEYTEYLRGLSDAELRAEIDKPKAEQVQDEIRKLEIQNAAANFLRYPWNDKLYELDDKTLNARLQVFSEMTGIPVDQIDIEDLRNTKGVDATNLINLGGAVDIANAVNAVNDWNKFRDIDISSIDANSPLDQQMYKLELLRKEREMLRDETMSTKILNGAIGSIPFMVEFALTGPIAGGLHEGASMGTRQLLRTLVASGYKEVFRRGGLPGVGRALGQGLKEVAVSGVKRLPFYIPKITAETLNEVAPSTITLIGEDGKPTVELSEKDVNDFFQRFITNALSQYSELASEEMGALLPNVMPKLVRNYVVNNLVSNPMSRKIASRLMDRVSFDGLLGEFSEEEIGNFMMYGVTLLENALQFRRENTAMVDTPLLGKEDTLATLGSIAIQSGLLNTTGVFLGQNSERAMIQQAIAARSVIKNADAIVDGLKKINSVGNDTGQLRVAIDTLNGGKSGSVEIAVSEAEALFQAVKNESEEVQNDLIEAFTAMGLTQDVVQQHKRKGTDIVLSDSQIFAVARNFKAGRDAMHRIFDNASTAVFGKTAKDLASSDFTKEQLDKMLEDRVIRDNAMKRWQGIINESLRTAQENAIAAGNPVGLTQSAIRNYESMMPFLANYLGTNALGEEGLKRVDAMVEGISFEFIKDPEAFDPNQAMEKIIGSGTVRELENRVNELKAKLETMQKNSTATGEEYLKLSEEYSTAKQELEEAKANPVFQTVQSLNDSISAAAKQEIGSGETSLDQVAAGFKKIDFQPGTVNLDLGGGKFDKGTEYLAGKGVTNLVYDPVNRSAESNTRIYEAVQNGGVDTVTCNNVLNVIKEAGARSNVILQAAKALKPGGVAYFTVYEGDGTGNSRETSKGWQEHRKTADYVDEIKQHFGDVVRKGKIIEARDPIVEGKTSAWFNEGFGANPALFQIVPVDRIKQKRKQKQWTAVYEAYELALKMEDAGAPPEAIRQATGWERVKYGDSSILVYDMPDNYKPSEKLLDAMKNGVDVSGLTFEECFEVTPELKKLYSLYPYLKKAGLEVIKVVPATNTKRAIAAYDWYRNRFYLSEDIPEDLIPFAIAHEVQHYIQWTGMGIDHRAGDSWSSTPTELNAIDASYRGTLSDEDRRNKTIASTSRDAIEATIAMQKDYSRRKKRIDQKELGVKEEEAAPQKRRVNTMTVYVDGKKEDDWKSNPGLLFIVTWIRRGGEKRLQKEIDNLRDEVSIIESGDSVPPHLSSRLADIKYLLGEIETFKQRVDVERTQDFTGLVPGHGLETRHDLFQKENDRIYRGVFLSDFKYSHDSLIGLFNGANASTLPHESAHWLKRCMEDLIGAGLANDKMIEDMNTINAWLDKQAYSLEAAREQGLAKTDKSGKEFFSASEMREEYFARAFETYLTEGKFPETSNSKLRSALHRLANALKTIYRNALALNAPIDDSIRAFFDGLFAVDQVVEDTSTLEAILRVVDAGAIALPKDALKDLEKDVELAREDAETEANLAALRAYCKGLSEQKKGWRDEAKAAYMVSKAEQAFAYVRKGHRISEDFLRNVMKLDEETIAILKGKRLTVKGTPAKVKSEAQAEAPVEEKPLVEPAPEVPPVTLEGINESNISDTWKSIDKNAPVIIPDVDTLSVVLNMLIDKGESHNEQLNEVYWKLTQVGKKSGLEYYKVNKDGKVRTKENFENLVYGIIHKKNVEDFKEQNETDRLDDTDREGRSVHEKIAAERKSSVEALKRILNNLEEVVNEMEDGEDKMIAEVILRRAKEEEDIRDKNGVNGEILNEYLENGGTLGKSARYKHLSNVREQITEAMEKRGIYVDFYEDFELLQTENSNEVLPSDILETMRETGYEDIMSLLDDLRTAVGERQFIKNFMLDKEAQYRDSFLQNPVWNSETGALRYMDALLRALKLTEGMKYNERKKLAIQKAKDEIEALKVRDIVSEERNARMSLKSNAEAIMKALKDKKHDKEAAITAAVFMHANAVRLEAIRKVREKLDNTRNYVRRMSKLKPGSTVEGDAVTAIVDVLFHLKLTARRPAWSGEPGAPQSVTGVFREIVERSIGEMGLTPDMLGKDGYPTAGQIVEAEMGQWSEWLMNQISGGTGFVDDYRDLTFDQFEEVRDFVEWLRDRGHDTVANDKATFAAKRRETMDGILASLDENATGKYTRHQDKTATEKLRAMTRTGQHQLKTLVFMSHFLDGNTEFYGEHKIGAFRKLQLKVSEGVARQQFWYQKISSAVKPHVLALMKSAKDRKLRFEVKNEITKDVYDDIHGETAAFVLLNAGQVDGRQRLMSGFGWTEEELDDNLRQFTEEDFKHAEAIWAELNTLGRELAKVFYQQRHYRMKWAKLAPINLILNDGKGTHIMSEGGYYPIAYSYREGEEVRNDDIMNPFRAPARLARPSATYGREARVENAALLLSPTVIERSIMENARYIGLWEPLRMMNSIWTDGAVKRSIIRNFSEEAYDTLRDLMNQVNDPDRGEKGKWKKIVSYLGSAMAVAALGFKATTMAKQYASLSIGAERLKAVDPKTGQMRNFFMESFQKGLTNLKKLRDTVSNESPFLRDRYNLIDKDLKVINSEFKSKFGKAVDWYRRWAFFGLKWNDLNVAVVQWDAAYNWALFTQKDMTESEARAFADDFVASTQGGARDVDIPEVQLSTFGRLITPFFGPSAAAANTRIAGLSTMRDMTPAERIIFVVDNLLVPGLEQAVVMAVSAGAIGWAASGGDDEDAWDRVQQKFLISMLTEPLSGIPLIQDISDAAIRSAVTGKPVQSGVFDVSLFRPLEESARDMNQIIRNMKNMEDFGYSLYLGASIAGVLTRMPIIQVYEDYERMLINNNFWFSDERAEKQLKGER